MNMERWGEWDAFRQIEDDRIDERNDDDDDEEETDDELPQRRSSSSFPVGNGPAVEGISYQAATTHTAHNRPPPVVNQLQEGPRQPWQQTDDEGAADREEYYDSDEDDVDDDDDDDDDDGGVQTAASRANALTATLDALSRREAHMESHHHQPRGSAAPPSSMYEQQLHQQQLQLQRIAVAVAQGGDIQHPSWPGVRGGFGDADDVTVPPRGSRVVGATQPQQQQPPWQQQQPPNPSGTHSRYSGHAAAAAESSDDDDDDVEDYDADGGSELGGGSSGQGHGDEGDDDEGQRDGADDGRRPRQQQMHPQTQQQPQFVEVPTIPDEEYEPTDVEILEYCEWLGMDPVADRCLTWIAREALKAPLPEHWKLCYTEDHEVYYFHVRTGESIWDHPMDAYYRALFKQEKQKLDKRRQRTRTFGGALEVRPVAEFFSDHIDDAPSGASSSSTATSPFTHIPEHLFDVIDFRIFVDPVVLPTSGRTVSRHTIVNAKWRDPFSREYTENRRLIPNVDKRQEVEYWLTAAAEKFFNVVPPTLEGVRLIVEFVPFLLDREDDVSVKAQRTLLNWLTGHAKRFDEDLASRAAALATAALRVPVSSTTVATAVSAQAAGSTYSTLKKSSHLPSSQTKPTGASKHHSSAQKTSGSASKTASAKVAALKPTDRSLAKPPQPPPAASDATDDRANHGAVAPQANSSPINRNLSPRRQPAPIAAPSLPPQPPDIIDIITAKLAPAELSSLLSSLLTMASSASRDILMLLLSKRPELGSHAAFRGWSDDVLHVLFISSVDLGQIAAALRFTPAAPPVAPCEPPRAAVTSDNAAFPAASRGATVSTVHSAREDDSSVASGLIPVAPLGPRPSSSGRTSSHLGSASGRARGTSPPQASTAASAAAAVPPPPRDDDTVNGSDVEGGTRRQPDTVPFILPGTVTCTNGEHVSALRLVRRLAELTSPVSALARVPLQHAISLGIALAHTDAVGAAPTVVNRMLRSFPDWPSRIDDCSDDTVSMLYALAIADTDTRQAAAMLYDVVYHSGERQTGALKHLLLRHDEKMEGSGTGSGRGAAPSSRHHAILRRGHPFLADFTGVLARDYVAGICTSGGGHKGNFVDLLAALLVFHEIVKIDDLIVHLMAPGHNSGADTQGNEKACPEGPVVAHPQLALQVGYNLFPRLVRAQWRPKHFEHCVSCLTQLMTRYPLETYRAVRGVGTFYFLRELNKKKRLPEEARSRLNTIEATEHRLRESSAVARWGVLTLKLTLVQKQREVTATSAGTLEGSGGLDHEVTAVNVDPAAPCPAGKRAKASELVLAQRPRPTLPICRIEAKLQRAELLRRDLQCERARHVVECLQMLLSMRLKPKGGRGSVAVGGAVAGQAANNGSHHAMGGSNSHSDFASSSPYGSSRGPSKSVSDANGGCGAELLVAVAAAAAGPSPSLPRIGRPTADPVASGAAPLRRASTEAASVAVLPAIASRHHTSDASTSSLPSIHPAGTGTGLSGSPRHTVASMTSSPVARLPPML